MLLLLWHIPLTFCSVFLLASCVPQLMIFLSKQGPLGWYDKRFCGLKTKQYKDWTDEEVQYVLNQLLRDTFLVAVFILQHSLMATKRWRHFLSRLHIDISQRFFYTLATSLALMKLMNSWASTREVVLWEIDTRESFPLYLFFLLLHGACWVLLLLQCALMDPLEMVGIKQVYYYHKGRQPPSSYMPWELRTLYSHMRHAGPFCLSVVLWAHPLMTLDRLLLAALLSFYMRCGHRVTIADYTFTRTYFVWEGAHLSTGSYYKVLEEEKRRGRS